MNAGFLRVLRVFFRSLTDQLPDANTASHGRENVQGLGANQIGACIMDGPKSIRNMSEISEVSEVSELGPKFEYCLYRNIANFW